MITPFDKVLSGELVLMMGSINTNLRHYGSGGLRQEIARGGILGLFDHWIQLKS